MAAPQKWTLPGDPELIELYGRHGQDAMAVAVALGVPRHAVYYRLARIGVARRRSGPGPTREERQAARREVRRAEQEHRAAELRAERARVLENEYRALTGRVLRLADPRLDAILAALEAILTRIEALETALVRRPGPIDHRRIVDGGSHPRDQRRRARLDAVG